MAFNNDISSAIAQYVYIQSEGNVTQPSNESYLQALCEYFGVTEALYNNWLITLCDYYGITEPLNGSWTIALADYHNITYPYGGSWWIALAFADAPSGILPIADFSSDITTVEEGLDVSFQDLSTVPAGGSAITAWSWTFAGGTPSSSSAQNPTVQYNTVGQYQVSLQVTNDDGSNTKTVPNYITVETAPVLLTNWSTTGFGLQLNESINQWTTNAFKLNYKI